MMLWGGRATNIAIGVAAGFNLINGSGDVFVGSQGAAGDNGVIRIGTPGTQTSTFIAGIRGTTTALNDALPVVIDSAGQLGTISPTSIANLPAALLLELQSMKRRAEAAESALKTLEKRLARLEAMGSNAKR